MIEVSAPVRICDNGGWTDTWFGGPGRVVNIAVAPGARVTVRRIDGQPRVELDIAAGGDRYDVVPGELRTPRYPLVEAAVDVLPPPGDVAVEIAVGCDVPPGSGTGTSAAVAVALVGALGAARHEVRTAGEIARVAHRLEVDVLGAESGIQDQLSSVHGGISYIEIESYPDATVRTLPPWDELGSLLTLVYLGRAHDSSSVHRDVINSVNRAGSVAFAQLRDAATAARDAVLAQDLRAFGRATIANTEAQRALHPALVGIDADRVIRCAEAHGAVGWKVNGAGGDGGSVTIVSPTAAVKHDVEAQITAQAERYQVLPVSVSSTGLLVEGSSP